MFSQNSRTRGSKKWWWWLVVVLSKPIINHLLDIMYAKRLLSLLPLNFFPKQAALVLVVTENWAVTRAQKAQNTYFSYERTMQWKAQLACYSSPTSINDYGKFKTVSGRRRRMGEYSLKLIALMRVNEKAKNCYMLSTSAIKFTTVIIISLHHVLMGSFWKASEMW